MKNKKRITQADVREWLKMDRVGWHDARWQSYRFSKKSEAIGYALHTVIGQCVTRRELIVEATKVANDNLDEYRLIDSCAVTGLRGAIL